MADEEALLSHTVDDDTVQNEKKCQVNHYMIPAKVAYLFKMAMYDLSTFSMMFYVSIGINPSDAGLIKGLQYVGGFFGAPLWGIIGDNLRCYRLISITVCLMAIISMSLQPYISLLYGDPSKNTCPINKNITNHILSSKKFNTNDQTRLYFSILAVAVIGSFFDSGIMSYIDSGVIQRILSSPMESNYGKQRYIGSLGTALGALSNSFAVTYFPHMNISCYTGLFVTYFVYGICLSVTCYFLFDGMSVDEDKKPSQHDILSGIISNLQNVDTLFFLFNVLLNGIVQATLYSFIYLYLQSLGAPTLLFGISMTVAVANAGLVYMYSNQLIFFLGGSLNSMSISWIAWTLKMYIIAYIRNPYFVLFADLLQGFSYGLYRSASLQHSSVTRNSSIIMSMCGIVNALHNPLGFFIANVAGGKIYNEYGGQMLFFCTAILSAISALVTIFYALLVRYRDRRSEVNK